MRMISLSEVSKDVKVVDGVLYFGERKVDTYTPIDGDAIPSLYVVRVKGSYWQFVTGFDLVGKCFWIGGISMPYWKDQRQVSFPPFMVDRWELLADVFYRLCADTIGKDWMIFQEEDFDAAWAEMQQQQDDYSE